MEKTRGAVTLLVCISGLFFMTHFAFADDTTADDWVTSSGNTYVTSGNVGIGTDNPSEELEVAGDIKLEKAANSIISLKHDNDNILNLGSLAGAEPRIYLYGSESSTNPGDIYIASGGTTNYVFLQPGGGNVGIGTTSPDYKLDVLGTIRAEEVKVETGWSDFVFEDDYTLPSLDHVETFIKENKHLPDIPSAKEVKENGLPLAEIVTKQMQKIEELTLYLIEMKKENDEIKQELAELKKQLN